MGVDQNIKIQDSAVDVDADITPDHEKGSGPAPSGVARDLDCARRVLTAEAHGLSQMAASLDHRFSNALDVLAGAEGGRVVVSGMGKSGHVGCKIAATFASTGTPSHFVHPGEASHGDLGMITERDAILALSNSGETWELSDLIRHASRFRIPLVAITSGAESTLARAASVALLLPDCPEAGAMGLAPTTSTTMTLALGDALAVGLLERRGFTATDFRVFHPGGKLGRQLSKVGDLMHSGDEVPLTTSDATMAQAVLTMTSKHFGCTGVVDHHGALIGVVTDGDLRRHISADLTEQKVEAIMTHTPVTVSADMIAPEVLNLMNRQKISAVFVVDDRGRPEGIVHLHDFLRAGVA